MGNGNVGIPEQGAGSDMVFAGPGIDKLVVLFEVGQRKLLHHSFVYIVSILYLSQGRRRSRS